VMETKLFDSSRLWNGGHSRSSQNPVELVVSYFDAKNRGGKG